MEKITRKQYQSFKQLSNDQWGISENDRYNLDTYGIDKKLYNTIKRYCVQIAGMDWRTVTYQNLSLAIQGKKVNLTYLTE